MMCTSSSALDLTQRKLIGRDERDADAGSEAGSRRPRGKSTRDWSEAPSEITITTTSEVDDEEEEEEEEEDRDPTPKKSVHTRKTTSGRRSSARRVVQKKVVKEEPEEEEEEGTEVGDSDHVEGLLDEGSDSEEDEMLL